MRSVALLLIVMISFTLFGFSDEDRAKREFKYAYGLYREGLFEESAEQFKGIISHYPEFKRNDYVRYLMAECFYQLKNYQEAGKHYERLINDFSGSVLRLNGMISLAWCYYHQKNYNKSHEILSEAITSYHESPTIADAYQFRGDIYLIEKEYIKASEMFEEYLRRFEEKSESVMFKSGTALFEGKDFLKSIWRFKQLIEKFPDTDKKEDVLARIAQSSYNLQDYDQTIEYCDRILEMEKNSQTSPAVYLKSLSLFQKGDYKISLAGFDSLLKEEHTIPVDEILFRCGKISYNLNNYSQSRKYFSRLLKEHSDSSFSNESRYLTGITFLRENEHKKVREAFEEYKKFVEKIEDKQNADFIIASSFYSEEKFLEAYKKFDGFIKDYPQSDQIGQVSFLRAEALYNLGKYDDALAGYQEITGTKDFDEYYARSHFAVGEIYYLKKEYEKAIKAFEMVDLKDTTSLVSDTIKRIGDCYYQLKKDNKALEYYEKLAKTTKRDRLGMEMNFRVARINYDKNRFKEAREGFLYVLKKAPDEYKEDLYFYLAQSEKGLKNYSEAIKYYEYVIKNGKIKDLVLKSLKGIGYCFYSQKDYIKAIENYRTMVDEFKGGELVAEAQYWIAKSFMMMDDNKNALLEYLKVTILFPEYKFTPHSYIKIGELYEKLGNKKKATETYQKYLSLYKDSKESEMVSQKLKSLL